MPCSITNYTHQVWPEDKLKSTEDNMYGDNFSSSLLETVKGTSYTLIILDVAKNGDEVFAVSEHPYFLQLRP
jgi:hypothetical protein